MFCKLLCEIRKISNVEMRDSVWWLKCVFLYIYINRGRNDSSIRTWSNSIEFIRNTNGNTPQLFAYVLWFGCTLNYRYIRLLIRASNENCIYPFLPFDHQIYIMLCKRALDSNRTISHHSVFRLYLFLYT